MGVKLGRVLKEGDCVAVAAPSSHLAGAVLYRAMAVLRGLNLRVRIGGLSLKRCGFFSGSDRERAAELNRFFADDSVQAIICLRGGYGAARILPYLDYELIAEKPKLFIGYSDITAIHAALNERCGLATAHAAMMESFLQKEISSYTVEQLARGVFSSAPLGEVLLPSGRALFTLNRGRAAGKICGGNLTTLASLVGTPYELHGENCLLFLEEVNELPYKIDRLLNQLWQSGLLTRASGIIYGDFTECGDAAELFSVLKYYAVLAKKPALLGLAAGHGFFNMFLPLGVNGIMECGEKASLIIDEAHLLK